MQDVRTTGVCTLLPLPLGGIVSIRQVNPTGPNTDTWYGCDRQSNVMLTVGASGTSAQDAYRNELASETTGQWATAANAEGCGSTTKWCDGDVELNHFWERSEEPQVGGFTSPEPLPSSRVCVLASDDTMAYVDTMWGRLWRRFLEGRL